MKTRYWSLAIVLILVNYLIFATLFTQLTETDFTGNRPTRTPIPTFTPAPAQPIIVVPTPVPVTPEPSPTATPVVGGSGSNLPNESTAGGAGGQPAVIQSAESRLTALGSVNIRSGPGTDYNVIGTLNPNTAMRIVGRNPDASWWQIEITSGTLGWVSNTVVNVSNAESVPVIQASVSTSSVLVHPASSNLPPMSEKPEFQYSPAGWQSDGGAEVTRFSGEIRDNEGKPANGVSIQASCGDYSVISSPSGTLALDPYSQYRNPPEGFYDLTVDTKPVPCLWLLSVVDTDDGDHVKAVLSEAIPVEVTQEKSSIIANWYKNW